MNKYLALIIAISLSGCLKTRQEINEMTFNRDTQTQVSTLQKEKAEQENKVLVLQDEIRNLNGRIDMLERQAQESSSESQKGPTNADLIEQMKIFEQTINDSRKKIAELEGKLAESQAKATASASATPAKKVDSWSVAEEQFNNKDWKNAILTYQAYRDQNPKGAHYAQATYKIGVSFQELKMKDEAKAFYQEVIQKFPKSPTARKAQFKLSQIK